MKGGYAREETRSPRGRNPCIHGVMESPRSSASFSSPISPSPVCNPTSDFSCPFHRIGVETCARGSFSGSCTSLVSFSEGVKMEHQHDEQQRPKSAQKLQPSPAQQGKRTLRDFISGIRTSTFEARLDERTEAELSELINKLQKKEAAVNAWEFKEIPRARGEQQETEMLGPIFDKTPPSSPMQTRTSEMLSGEKEKVEFSIPIYYETPVASPTALSRVSTSSSKKFYNATYEVREESRTQLSLFQQSPASGDFDAVKLAKKTSFLHKSKKWLKKLAAKAFRKEEN